MHNKSKGFTLTELLIVVMIIGILATVIVPKFNTLFTGSQISEAENILTAIRQEQVVNCVTEDRYKINDAWRLSSVASLVEEEEREFSSKYFLYQVNNGFAKAMGLKHKIVLQIFYEDGRICCDDTNNNCAVASVKNFPSCRDLMRQADFKPSKDVCCLDNNCQGTNNPHAIPEEAAWEFVR